MLVVNASFRFFLMFTLFVGFKNKMKCERTKPGKGFGLELLHAFRLKTKKKQKKKSNLKNSIQKRWRERKGNL